MSLTVLFQTFLAIFLAEFGDKTQLAIVLIACNHPRPFWVFLAACLAFTISTLIGCLAGGLLANYAPLGLLDLGSGFLFLFFAVFGFKNAQNLNDEDDDCDAPKLGFLAIFLAFFMAEMRDKSQIEAFGLATANSLLPVFLGASLALILNALLAVILGSKLSNLSNRKKIIINYLSASFFLIIGLYQIYLAYLNLI